MKILLTYMLAATVVLGSCAPGFAMAEFSGEDIELNDEGCWGAENPNYTATGALPGHAILLVRMKILPEDADGAEVTKGGFLNMAPRVYDDAGGESVADFKGVRDEGTSVFYVAKAVQATVTYTDGKGGGYNGYIQLCALTD